MHICHTGGDALKLLNDLRPDVLIINLCLHDTDGLTVLRNTQYIPPTVQALTYILDDTAVQIAKSYGVGGIILLPCTIQAIVDQLEKLTQI